MATLQQVLAYLNQYRGKYPLPTLKAGLLKQGVPEAMIEQAIAAMGTGTPPAAAGPAPAQPPTQPPTQRPPGQTPPPTQPPAPRPPGATPQAFPFRTPTQIGIPISRTPPPTQMPPAAQPPAQPSTPPPATRPPGTPMPAQLPPAAATPPAAGTPISKRTYVLVVDDDALIRDMLVAKLEGAGFKVTCAEDAAQSVIQAEGMKLSLIISDIEMPGFGTGVDALKKLRSSSFVRRDMPVIFVTGMPPHEAQKIVPKTDPYLRLLHKPVDWRLMRQYIRELTGMDAPLD
ncbi:MAG: response regulator [Elusimicrobia bacterium]|nr:response regulator [Elusimicrobiota bacterium]